MIQVKQKVLLDLPAMEPEVGLCMSESKALKKQRNENHSPERDRAALGKVF